MSTYKINLETATHTAFSAINDIDRGFIGTPDYLGVAYFWAHEFKHHLRGCTIAQRKRVHKLWLKNGLSFHAGIDSTIDTKPHWEIINRVCRDGGNI
jgi:hypothetical protein